MALNVPLTSGPDGSFPLPFPGETFVLTRDKISMNVKDGSLSLKNMKGRLFVTSMRQVFMPANPAKANNIESFEFPWRGLWDERFNQPIFGCNNLTATVQYYDGEPFIGQLCIELVFKEGGCNTYLPVFNNILRATRVQMQIESEANASAEPGPIPEGDSVASAPIEYFPGNSEAFVDPSDPSRLYTTQPIVEDAERRQNKPNWNPSASGLRRRH